ncbi:RNA polymerase sigma-70 factor (ECF subfamily) [Lipingzhangella halophila]|uniref:RNA polymerase sigma-70 factor (ECF subfamily) n=1 Tax=Lipingzhangella halophila TaxID=1783352 RepID=A0A7W7RHT0_9ACTN|nr:sigma-70 family RNA polymerase sigma factor [Lipingzhangella halophila]MBB4932223.1 RNA polymerase sigma-70 factor (ECF subfamily) [Lipingzhangella halophila]
MRTRFPTGGDPGTRARPARPFPSGPVPDGRAAAPRNVRATPGTVDDRETTALAFAARRGEANAVEAFVRATRGDVWRFVSFLTDADSADDLTQETYVRALRGLARFAGRSQARVWLLAIARRVVADHYRKRAARPTVATANWQRALDQSTWQETARFDEELALIELLDSLTSERRSAFFLTQVAGLSYKETAVLTDCPVGTVRSRVARARRDLVHALRFPEPPDGGTREPAHLIPRAHPPR